MFCRRRDPPEGIFWTPVWSCFGAGLGLCLDLSLGSGRPLRQRFHPLYQEDEINQDVIQNTPFPAKYNYDLDEHRVKVR